MKKLFLLLLFSSLALGAIYEVDAPSDAMDQILTGAMGQPEYKDALVNMASRYKQLKLTTAQVLAINTSPQMLIASPGAGKVIVATAIYGTLDYNSATYSGGGALEATYGPNGSRAIALPSSFVTSSDDDNQFVPATLGASELTDLSGQINKGLFLQADTADPTTGDSDIFVRIYYKIVPALLTP